MTQNNNSSFNHSKNNNPKSNTPENNNKNQNNNVTRHVSVAIIGAGTAGQNAFRQAKKTTKNIVIINHGFWTTTCATVGCMPSKLMLAAAERAHDAKNSADFGVSGDINIDGKQVMKRVHKLRDDFTGSVQKQVSSWDEDKKIAGKAKINKDGLIEVNDEVIKADKIIIATGSSPFVPEDWAEKLKDKLLTSDSVFGLTDLPKSLAVIGAGAVGLELAQAFSRLGVAVTLFNRTQTVGGLGDDKINDKAIDCLSKDLTMKLGSEIKDVGVRDDAAFVSYKDRNGKAQDWQGEFVLVATGRRNHIKALGIENLGVELDDKERPKNLNINTGQIDDLDVYVIGDANAHLPLLHVASDEGFSAGSEVCPNNSGAYIRPPAIPISIVFTSPQIANVGQSLQDIKDNNLNFVIGKVDFAKQGRSRIMGVNCGLLHIYACKETDRILGASMAAPDAEYLAHILAIAITNQISIKQLLDAPFYHPTILEGLRTALRDIQSQMQIPHQVEGNKDTGF